MKKENIFILGAIYFDQLAYKPQQLIDEIIERFHVDFEWSKKMTLEDYHKRKKVKLERLRKEHIRQAKKILLEALEEGYITKSNGGNLEALKKLKDYSIYFKPLDQQD